MPASWTSPDVFDTPPGPGASGASPLPPHAAAELLALYQRVTRALMRPAEAARITLTVVEEATCLVGATGAVLYVPDLEDDGVLRALAGAGSLSGWEGELLPTDGSFVGRAIQTGEGQHSPDLAVDARAYPLREAGREVGPALALPLRGASENVAVLLIAREPGGAAFSSDDTVVVGATAELFAVALENTTLFQRARGDRTELRARRRETETARWFSVYEAAARMDGRAVFLWNIRTEAFDWGDTLTSLLGYPPAEFGSTMQQWLPHVKEDDRAEVADAFSRAAREGVALLVHCRMIHNSGATRQIVLRATLPPAVGVDQVIGILEDVTERERLATSRDKQSRADAATEIIRALRHEINNPLAVVIGQLQLLQKEDAVAENPLLQESLEAIQQESVRMHELVRRLAALEQYPREPFVTPTGGVNIPGE